jgi:16S rRNA (adenine1518-N6/adenine1519-N6)-dimethyltransferase
VTLYEEVRAALRETGLRPSKRLGQSFLIHERVIESILELLALRPDDEVLEIGPGLGFLTRRLAEQAGRVYAVEVDERLVNRIRSGPLGTRAGVHLIHGDILKLSLDDLLPTRPIKLAGNLPYSISTPVLFHVLEARKHFSSLVLMVQKEVADRIAGAPGTKSYGTLSVWCQVHGAIAAKVPVAPEAFYPQPKVRSTVLRIDLFSEPRLAAKDLAALRGLLRAAFGQRRKTLGNAMTAWFGANRGQIDAFLRRCNIDPIRRGETLTVDEFLALSAALGDSGLRPAQGYS